MKKLIRAVLAVSLLCIFGFSIYKLLYYYLEYQKQDALYQQAAHAYVEKLPVIAGEAEDICPISVDFGALLAENEDIIGWLYCEDTNINYPVVQGEDNDYYLHHAYNGKESRAGAVFAAAENSPDFTDCNTILYGHHMKNGSMFAHLADWGSQEYFDAHPVMWLLTPDEIYRADLFAGYLTLAASGTYTIFPEPCAEFDVWLSEVIAASEVQTAVETPKDAHYIVLSTCEYDFQDARYVLFGVLKKGQDAEAGSGF